MGGKFVLAISGKGANDAIRGMIAAYKMHFFMRLRPGSHERLMPIEALDGALKQRVAARLATIFPTSWN